MITLRSYVGGRWTEGKGSLQTLVNPATEEPLAQAGSGGIDMAGALHFARTVGGPALRAMRFAERGALLKAMCDAIQAHRDELLAHGGRSDGARPRRGIVWAHNTHVGDYRATDMSAAGLVNLGGLARQRWGGDSVALVGFGTYAGSVIAAPAWDGPTTLMTVPPAHPGSYEEALHEARATVGSDDLLLVFDDASRQGPLSHEAGHRAIGVVYDPQRERQGNWVPTRLTQRYDAFVFLDRTHGLHPVAASAQPHELPETWPSGV